MAWQRAAPHSSSLTVPSVPVQSVPDSTPCKSMASHTVLLPLLLSLPFLLVMAATADTAAPGPSPPPELNLTSILENGGQYTTLLRLLNATRITEQISSQLKNSYDGLTFFAPNDAAFTKLRAGTLNALTDQEQIQLLLYHVLPRYYSLATFQTASNPLHTEASGPGGMYSVNVTTSTTSSLVNVSTGVVDVPISSTLSAHFPFAVYSIDDVLQPPQMFGSSAHKASAAPAPGQAAAAAAAGKKGVPKSDVAAEPSEAGEEPEGSTNAAAATGRGTAVWMTVIVLGVAAWPFSVY